MAHRLWQQMNIPQDVQKVRPARPPRVKGRGGTNCTSCGPFASRMDPGERKNPFSSSGPDNLFGTLRV